VLFDEVAPAAPEAAIVVVGAGAALTAGGAPRRVRACGACRVSGITTLQRGCLHASGECPKPAVR
jgi:hypothetical protein